MNQGKLLVFSAPSGSGKTTIVRHLLKRLYHILRNHIILKCFMENKKLNHE